MTDNTAMRKRVGIIGGTFDPVHYGHLLAAAEAYRAYELSEVIFIPTGTPPHKGQIMTSAENRWAMVLLATNNCPYFSVSRMEIDRGGNSYTTDTFKALRRLGRFSEAEFYFIVGIDALMLIETWKEPRELLSLCRIIAVSRYGYSFDMLETLPKEYRKIISVLKMSQLDISSTEIRERLKNGGNLKFLLPPAVENYIEKNKLYRSQIPGE